MIKCFGQGVVGLTSEAGVYLLIGSRTTNVNPKKKGKGSNVYAGQVTPGKDKDRTFSVRFHEHEKGGKDFYDTREFHLPDWILQDSDLMDWIEQELINSFGGKLRTGNARDQRKGGVGLRCKK